MFCSASLESDSARFSSEGSDHDLNSSASHTWDAVLAFTVPTDSVADGRWNFGYNESYCTTVLVRFVDVVDGPLAVQSDLLYTGGSVLETANLLFLWKFNFYGILLERQNVS